MVLMQDNASPHTARTTVQMLANNNIRTIESCSSDLNPIKDIWDAVDRLVRQLPAKRDLVEMERDLVCV